MARWARTAVLAIVALVVCAASVYFLPVRDAGAMNWGVDAEIAKIADDVAELDRRAERVYRATVAEYQQRRISPAEAQRRIQRDIVTEYRGLQETLELAAAPQQDCERLVKYVLLRREAWSLAAQAIGEGDAMKRIEAEAKFKAANDLVAEGNGRPET
jgi:hypothetical protein